MARNTQAATRSRTPRVTNQPAAPVVELTPAEQAGVATHDAIVTGATAVKDGVVYVGEAVAEGATGLFNFVRRTITGA